MLPYVRPNVPHETVLDASGEVIDYGNRWGAESAPEEAYSVTSNLARFEPLHRITDALVEYLVATFDVAVTEDPSVAADLLHAPQDVSRAVRVTPSNVDAASLTFVYTPFPGVLVHAGLLHDFLYPVCGCDACDDTWQGLAGEMEREVMAVTSGHYRERVEVGGEVWVSYSLEDQDGRPSESGRSRVGDDYEERRLHRAGMRLSQLPDGWRPWSTRG